MSHPNHEVTHEARQFDSVEEAIAFLQSIPQPDSIIILTPPPAH